VGPVAWACAFLLATLAACGGGADTDDGDNGGGGPRRWEGLIRADVYDRLVLEVDAVADRALRPGVLDDLGTGFTDLLDKPAGIVAVADATIDSRGADHAWTFDELAALANEAFDLAVDDTTIKVHVLLLDGRYESGGDGVVLGVAWANRDLALFVDVIEETCGAVLPPLLREQGCAAAQLAIATPELGHVIGLVDNGVPMTTPHRDPAHGSHDASDACVMYWAYDGEALVDAIAGDLLRGGDGQLDFDEACRADIAAVRDRAP
jgi:hypothetical protein